MMKSYGRRVKDNKVKYSANQTIELTASVAGDQSLFLRYNIIWQQVEILISVVLQ